VVFALKIFHKIFLWYTTVHSMKIVHLKKLNLPDTPGVYIWKKGSTILYIGKATSLRDRVRSYFSSDLINTRGPHILDMVTLSTDIEHFVCGSVLEAVILESNLIKKHQPKYNTKEKSNKSFYQVIITAEDWPRVMMVRERDLQIMELTGRLSRVNYTGKIKYTFGPFPSGTVLRESLKIIRKIFPFRDYKSTDITHVRFYEQLGLVPKNHLGTSSDLQNARIKYLKNIQHIKMLFQGKTKELLKQLERDMHAAAKLLAFEEAAKIKKTLFALQHINDISLIHADIAEDTIQTRIESYDIAHLSGSQMVGVMTVVTGNTVDKSEYRKFKLRRTGVDDYASLCEIITRRLKHDEWQLPDVIVVDGGIGQYNAVKKLLSEQNIDIPIVSVIKDTRHKPKGFHGNKLIIGKYQKQILLANSESHRFAIDYHKDLRSKDFLINKKTVKQKSP